MEEGDVELADDVTYFTEGFCYALAIELHRRLGFGIRAFLSDRRNHAVVRTPDGQYLDIRGLHTRKTFKAFWGPGKLKIVKPEYFDEWDLLASIHLGDVDSTRVKRAARRIIKNLVTLKCTECPAIKMVQREPCFFDFKEVETICPSCAEDPRKVKAHERRFRTTYKKRRRTRPARSSQRATSRPHR